MNAPSPRHTRPLAHTSPAQQASPGFCPHGGGWQRLLVQTLSPEHWSLLQHWRQPPLHRWGEPPPHSWQDPLLQTPLLPQLRPLGWLLCWQRFGLQAVRPEVHSSFRPQVWPAVQFWMHMPLLQVPAWPLVVQAPPMLGWQPVPVALQV